MAVYTIGDMIKGLRIRAGLTQEQLAYPILERGHLSKIERGVTTPSKDILTILFERLGYSPTFVMDLLIDNEAEQYEDIKKRINEISSKLMMEARFPGLTADEFEKTLVKNGINEFEDLTAQLENDETFMKSAINRQWLYHRKATVHILGNEFQLV